MTIGTWRLGTNGERFDFGDYATREQAVLAGPDELGLEPGDVFWTGLACAPNEDTPEDCTYGIESIEQHVAPEVTP